MKRIAVASLIFLGACAGQPTPEAPPPEPSPPSQANRCNPALAAAIGGIIGGMIADESRARGAVLGAGIATAACALINATTRQVTPSADVEQAYRASHGGRLPDRPTVTAYDTTYNAAGGVSAGQEARVVSTITLVRGASEPVRDAVEVLEVFEAERPDRVMLKAEKSLGDTAAAGGIQNVFTLRLPEGLAAGSYPARTTLFVNNQRVGENRGTLRVLAGRRIL
jgi:hypothetical protein